MVAPAVVLPEGNWVVVASATSTAAAVLSARLEGSIRVAPQGLAAALEGKTTAANIVCLWEVGAEENPAVTAQRVACEALGVIHALPGRAVSRLWWVTRGAVGVAEKEPVLAATATVWGLGRTVMQEQPELGCTLIDLESGDEKFEGLLRELALSAEENQTAWRCGRRYVARLVRATEGLNQAPARPSIAGTVLVTGGLGALGLHIARWLAEQGTAHLLLTGRRGLDTPGVLEAVAELQALGAGVTVAAVDVANRDALRAVIEAVSYTHLDVYKRQALQGAGVSTFVEVGPKTTLLGLVPGGLGETEATLVASLRADRAESEAVLTALGSLFVRGWGMDWKGVYPEGARRVELPPYAWQRQKMCIRDR